MKSDKSKTNVNNFKIMLLGEAGVGKTSLVTRYTRGKFSPQTTTTVGVNRIPLSLLAKKDYNDNYNENNDNYNDNNDNDNNEVFNFQLLDTAGCYAFHSLIESYVTNIDVVIFVYDITDKESFACLPLWNEMIKKTLQCNNNNKRLLKILLGNKRDMEHLREVQFKNATNYAEFEGMTHVEVSVKEE